MKLVRVGEFGRERAAVVGPQGELVALPDQFGDIDAKFWLRNSVNQVQSFLETFDAGDEITGDVRFGSPIAKPEKVICVGLNYRDHAAETGAAIPKEPILFMKAPNCVVGPNDQVLVPRGSTQTDWEVELGVVIGKRARYLTSPDESREVVAGYCVSHDVS